MVKNLPAKQADISSSSGLEISSYREGNGHPLQSSCLENPMDSRDWQATGGLKTTGHDLATKQQQYTFYIKQTLIIIISKGWGVDGSDTDDNRVTRMLLIVLKLNGLVQVTFLDQDTICYTKLPF